MRTLLVDNHDSYTYNVFHLLAGGLGRGADRGQQRRRLLAGALALGLRRDRALAGAGTAGTLARLRRLPRHPPLQRDPGARHLPRPPGDRQPARGRRQQRAEAMHGRLSHVRHDGDGLFEGIPQDFSVVRYHSLAITGHGPEGNVAAWADDGVVMGIEHRKPADVGRPVPPRVDRHRARRARSPRTSTRWRAAAQRRAPTPAAGDASGRDGAPRRRDAAGDRARRRATARCGCGRSRARRRPRRSSNGSSPTPSTPSGSTAPTRRPGWRSAPTWAPAPARDRCVLEYDVDAGEVAIARARGATRSSTARSSTCSTASCAEHAVEPPAGAGARPDRRLRRLPRLRAARPTAARPTCTAPTCPTR